MSDLVARVARRFGRKRTSEEGDVPTRRRARATRVVAASAVMVVPALAALLLTGPDATTSARPEVTRILESTSDAPAPPTMARRAAPDAPVARAAGTRKLAIAFERDARVPLGDIEIPAIGLETAFYDGVVDESVERGPGHWPGTPWPGETGNSVFAGHRTTYTRPFADLDLLNPGQRVRVRVRNGPTTTYRVFRTTVVPEAEYVDFVLQQPRNETTRMITLFACTPKGSRTHRIVVQAKAVPMATGGRSNREERRAIDVDS